MGAENFAFAQRLAMLCKRHGCKQETLAEDMEVSTRTIRNWESGTRIPTREKVVKLANYFNVSVDFLLGGTQIESRLPENVEIVRAGVNRIPLVSSIAAGSPLLCDETFDTYIDVSGHVKADYALRVSGDSMQPLYLNGDVVFIRAQSDVYDGQVAAVCIDDSGTLKRVYHIPNGIQLISENPRYAPMTFTHDAASNVHIMGLAVAFFRVTKP